jgi:hypothetical protein
VSAYKLTIRAGARVRKERHDDLAAALAALRGHADQLSATAETHVRGGRLMRRYEPVQQVIGRVEVKGGGIGCGVDVRGDGSIEAFTGRLGRTLVHQHPDESPYQALTRELGV